MKLGDEIIATVTEVKGRCSWGHKVGDSFSISCHDTAGLCGFFYYEIFPKLMTLQFGGGFPWLPEGIVELECWDKKNLVKIQLKRIKEN